MNKKEGLGEKLKRLSEHFKEIDRINHEVNICSKCGQPTNRYNLSKEVWDELSE